MANIMAADDLDTQGARASADMESNLFSQNISLSVTRMAKILSDPISV